MEERILRSQEVVYKFVENLREKRYLERTKKVGIYHCLDSFNDGIESGTAGIEFYEFNLLEIPQTTRTFALLVGKCVLKGRGNTDIMAEIRIFDVTDIKLLCADWITSQETMVEAIMLILKNKLEVSAAFSIRMEWHFPVDKGVVIRAMADGGILYKNKNLGRFLSDDRKNWKPELVEYIADDFIKGILDSDP